MTTPVWELDRVTVKYPHPWWQAPAPPVLREASFSVAAGERVGVVGTSGSGKTTLARVGLGLLQPEAGTVRLLGEDTSRWSASRWRAARRDAQLLFQSPRAMLNPGMTLHQLLSEGLQLHQPAADAPAAIADALQRVGLAGRGDAYPHQLSGGERRRAGLARVLVARPRVLVADEPTTGLDAARKASAVEHILDAVGPECAVVLISHDLPLLMWCCTRIVTVAGGEVVDTFTPAQALSDERPQATRALLTAAGVRP